MKYSVQRLAGDQAIRKASTGAEKAGGWQAQGKSRLQGQTQSQSQFRKRSGAGGTSLD